MAIPKITLGGVVLGGSKTYGWSLTRGFLPNEEWYTVHIDRTTAIEAMLGKPQTLILEGENGRAEFKNIYPVQIIAGPNRFIRRVKLVDARYMLPNLWARFDINATIPGGNLAFAGSIGGGKALTQITRAKRYAEVTLNGGIPFTIREAFERLLEFANGQILASSSFEFKTPIYDEADLGPQVELEDVALDHPMDVALQIVLGYMPEADVYFGADGVFHVFNKTNTEATSVLAVKVKQRQHWRGGDVQLSDKSGLIPKWIQIEFETEQELPLFFIETLRTTGASTTPNSIEAFAAMRGLLLDNVAPVTDFESTLPGAAIGLGNSDEITVPRGTWARIDLLMDTFDTFAGTKSGAGLTLSVATLRKLYTWLKRGSWSIFTNFRDNGVKAQDPVQGARMQAVIGNWRNTYRVSDKIMHEVSSLSPYRVTKLSSGSGGASLMNNVRAESPVFTSYIHRPSIKGVAKRQSPNRNQVVQQDRYEAEPLQLSIGAPAPFFVRMVDPDTGVFRIVPQNDVEHFADEILLGNSESYNKSSNKFSEDVPLQSFGAGNLAEVRSSWDHIILKPDFRMSCILTATFRNGLKETAGLSATIRKFVLTVKTEDICPGLKANAEFIPKIKVSPGVVTSRWEVFDSGTGERTDQQRGLWLHTNYEHVLDVGRAAAKRFCDQVSSRYLGSAEVNIDASIKPVGSVGEVRHTVNNGSMTTSVSFNEIQQIEDIYHLLDQGTRVALRNSLGGRRED